MTDEKPRKTLSITRKPADVASQAEKEANPPTGIRRTGKRIITREQLPDVQKPGIPKKPPKKPKKPTQGKRPRQPPKPKKTPPSELRARELNDSLNGFAVWLQRQPLALGIEKQVFRYIADHHLSASKRVVQRLLYAHTHRRDYLQAVAAGGMRYGLDGQEAEAITPAERNYAASVLSLKKCSE
ncbi:ProQ/FINO family protein [Thiothrix nivea]|uniref:Fertility inhibition FinO-like protein n=1 Tax=Thiothrix nivea (strain ATCC 35100 / DSM 5205 / JP2) TaxID=870187 RepID=A0A656HDT0_THINJ|nr:ProQ/FINO family protein [Thiothrix nivea]EIJ34523.1 Fertility inhibition FinO-like protein [Thiothrix nivea DSM 5205]